ncbi:hypothetical protein GCM10010234_40900 [Streptomyces hawaiiensis]
MGRQWPQWRRLLQWALHISARNGVAVRQLRRIADGLVQLSLLPGGSVVLVPHPHQCDVRLPVDLSSRGGPGRFQPFLSGLWWLS